MKHTEYIIPIGEEAKEFDEIFIGVLRKHKELIRCKDCKHRDPEDKKCDSGHGIVWQLPRPDDWYCADGERRTE